MAKPTQKLTPGVDLQMLEIRKPRGEQKRRQGADPYSRQFMQESNKDNLIGDTHINICPMAELFMITKKAKQSVVLHTTRKSKTQTGEKNNNKYVQA
jgi:hypothetical protein